MMIRSLQRNISIDETVYALSNGEIIEQYPDDYPYPSALILAVNGEPLHVVAGIGGGCLWIITAYNPTLDKWESDYKTRKAGK